MHSFSRWNIHIQASKSKRPCKHDGNFSSKCKWLHQTTTSAFNLKCEMAVRRCANLKLLKSESRQFCVKIPLLNPQNGVKNRALPIRPHKCVKYMYLKKIGQNKHPGDLVTRTGDREISSVYGRLPDNPAGIYVLICSWPLSSSGK